MTDQPQEAAEHVTDAVEADVVETDASDAVDTPVDGVDEPDAEPAAPVKNWSNDDEQEARLFGWKSPDEWKGEKPAGYIDDPKEFLGRVERSRIFQTMREKMSEQERKLAAVNDKALDQQRKDYEDKMRQITSLQRRAVEEADTETYDKLERHRMALSQNAPQAPEPKEDQSPAAPPEVVQFREQNDWAKDPVLWAEAVNAVNLGLQAGMVSPSDPKSQIEYAERAVRTKYPHLFDKPKPKPQSQKVDPGGIAPGSRGGRNEFDKLPSEAKDAFKRFVSRKIYADSKESREKYARDYNAS